MPILNLALQEYTRTAVSVHPLSPQSQPQPSHVYLWTDPLSRLAPELWTFEQFLRDKAHRWVGVAGEKEYAEVDRRREMKGDISPSSRDEQVDSSGREEGQGELEPFGRAFGKKWWTFEEGWINLNHGKRTSSSCLTLND